MARVIQIINGATTYNIGDGTYAYDVFIDNTGMPDINRILETGAYQVGSFDRGYRINSREIIISLYYSVDSGADADARRDDIYEIFSPHDPNDYLILKITRDDGDIRQINCNVTGSIGMHESDRVGYDQKFTVRLICADPIFYHPTEQTWTYDLSGTQAVPYTGTWIEYPIVELTGPFTNPLISLGGDYLSITGSIPTAETWTLDLRYGVKTLVDGVGASKISLIGGAYQGGLWRCAIRPWSKNISVTGGSGAASVDLTYYNRHLGA